MTGSEAKKLNENSHSIKDGFQFQMKDKTDYKKALIGNLKVLSHLFTCCYPTRPAAVLHKEMKAAHLEATISLHASET